jgi:hypothetical protein
MRHNAEPMKPAPPVTKTRAVESSLVMENSLPSRKRARFDLNVQKPCAEQTGTRVSDEDKNKRKILALRLTRAEG